MKKCPFCSSEILDDAEFCIYCMRELSPKQVIVPAKKEMRYKRFFAVVVLVIAVVVIALLIANSITNNTDGNTSTPTKSESDKAISETAGAAQDSTRDDAIISVPSDDSSQTQPPSHTDSSTDASTIVSVSPTTPSSPTPGTQTQTQTPGAQTPTTQTTPTTQPPTTQTPTTPEVIVPPVTDESPVVEPVYVVKDVNGGVEIKGIDTPNSSGIYEIPSTIDGKTVVGIGDRAFYYNSDLKGITLPNTITYIGEQAFANCTALGEITIPASVTDIRNNAFMSCSALSEVYIKSHELSIHIYAFSSSYQQDVPLTIYAPSSVINQYRFYFNVNWVEWNG